MLLICCAISSPPASARDYTTAEVITAAASSPQCLAWRVSGVCFWLICTPAGCYIETTARFAHNLPDLVVSAYNNTGDNPWITGRSLTGSVSASGANASTPMFSPFVPAAGGTLSSGASNPRGNTRFKEVDIIGSPTTLITDALASTGFLCESESVPFLPYFLSGLDGYAWRTGIPDMFMPESLIPGLRHIGNWPFNTWGRVYPREGWLVQSDDAKVGAVAAQRAIDVTLQPWQPHVYIPFGYDGFSLQRRIMGDTTATTEEACTASGGRWWKQANDGDSFRCGAQLQVFPQWMPPANEKKPAWQLVSPVMRTSCEAFGAPGMWSTERVDEDGDYGYLYWRCYECCYPNAGVYIGNVQWNGCGN